ncbi:MAG: polyprenyl synthetase family protein [Candidatus Bathyarchaeia archaeon]
MGKNNNIEEMLKEKAKLINQRIEKYIPRLFREDSLIFKLNPPRYKIDLEALNKAIAKPVWEFLDRGGKRWRPALFILVCEALGADSEEFLDFAVIPEIVHNGTLIADDIEDSSKARRGKLCTYRLFGLDVAVNVSQSMYFLPMIILSEKKREISSEKARKLYEIHIQEMINLSFGQAMDIAWHKGLIPANEVTEEHYLQMCAFKTGTLARMAAKMAAVLADADEETVGKMGRLAESIGIAFQIQDDVLDLVGEQFAKGKGGLGMDITEGKLTLMIIHTLHKADPADKGDLLRILSMHTLNKAQREKAIEIIKKYGSIDYAKEFASKIVQESWSEVDKILQPSEAKEKLKTLAEYLIHRSI